MKNLRIIFLILALGLIASCSSNNNNYKPKVSDTAKILKKKTIKTIEEKFAFPLDIPVYVRTVKELPLSKLGSIATEMMEDEAYWSEMRSRNLLSKLKGDFPWGTGIYILISEKPRLIQIRYGNDIRLEAYRGGLAGGFRYRQLQQKYYSSDSADNTLLETMQWLSETMPKALDIPWYLKLRKGFAAFTIAEFEELSLPSDGAYTNWLLKPYISMASFSATTINTVWAIFLTNAFIYYSIRFLFISLLITFILNKIASPATLNSAKSAISLILGGILSFPSLGSILMLNSGRLEDELALSQFGIKIPEFLQVSAEMFSTETGFLIALIVVFICASNKLLNTSHIYFLAALPDDLQVEVFKKNAEKNPMLKFALLLSALDPDLISANDVQKSPYTAIAIGSLKELLTSSAKWFVFLLFLPKAITFYALAIFLLPLPLYLLNTISSYKNYKKLKQSYKTENLLITSTEKKEKEPIQKVDCTNCGAKILPATFKNNNGLCAPCFSKQYTRKE